MELATSTKWELALQPPTVEELQKNIGDVFNVKWIKYMYANFKNECPSGKMHFAAFKNLFSPHLPTGVSDEYIKRLFFAFSFGHCEVTFQALLEALAMLRKSSAITQAKWTMRLISGSETKPVCYEEFLGFVRSIFVRKETENRNLKKGSYKLEESLALNKVVERRARHIFATLDRNEDGLIDTEELIEFFKGDGRINVQRLIGSGRTTC
ncbi:unnamed protein product [Enterobius vermicularis]|uniref:EF-hand domain-containing protein n=1 Tax=Enterobius vermicularis TaxID=51028 RepID=A0A0N4UXW0_ENTVE|nr:unnamed protein product [Enterobius vermicularis]